MPLDQVARRYADEMYNARMEVILPEQQRKRAENRAKHAARGLAMSGSIVSEDGRVQTETIRLLAEARTETLLKAYERAGIPFDDTVLGEITEEITAFCEIKKRHAADSLTQSVHQVFVGNAQPNMIASVNSQVESAINSILANIKRCLRIRRYEVVLDERNNTRVYAAGLGKQWDAFISHASEDKDEFVRHLAQALTDSGLMIWYDETTLKVGDSLRRAIEHGLANSRFGIVVLSHSFFAKEWPQQELDGLFTREVEGIKVILPVWHNITAPELRQYSPILAGRLATNSSSGMQTVVRQLREAMGL